MQIKNKENIYTNLTGVYVDGLMPAELFEFSNASKTRHYFGFMACQWADTIFCKVIVSKIRKPAPIKLIIDIHRCLSSKVIIDKNTALFYDVPYNNLRMPNKSIRAPPPCRA